MVVEILFYCSEPRMPLRRSRFGVAIASPPHLDQKFLIGNPQDPEVEKAVEERQWIDLCFA